MGRLHDFYDWILKILILIAGVLLIFLMLGVSLEVCLRYFFRRPISWMGEISGYILLYLPFLTGAWILKREGHVKMDLVFNRISLQTQHLLNTITSLIGAIVCFILTAYGIKVTLYLARVHFITPTVLMLPKSIISAVIFIGFFLMGIQFIIRFLQYLKLFRASLTAKNKKSRLSRS